MNGEVLVSAIIIRKLCRIVICPYNIPVEYLNASVELNKWKITQ
jgi:hypothetical protein